MQCGDTPIFIAGDADAQRPVLYEASAEGAIAGRNAATFPVIHRGKRYVPFSIMFTDPTVAVVGPPEAKDVVVGRASNANQGRAKVELRNAGFVSIYADRTDGRVVGAVLAGPRMDHIGHA